MKMKKLTLATCILWALGAGIWIGNMLIHGFTWVKMIDFLIYLICAVFYGLQAIRFTSKNKTA